MEFSIPIAALMAASTPPQQADIGATPAFEAAVRIGEDAIKATLVDPDSAKFEWPYNFVGGTLKAFLGKRQAGYFTCGFVNARNRMGGYTGRSWFLIMEKDGIVTSLSIAEVDGIDPASATCPGLVNKGFFPAAPSPAKVPDPAEMQQRASEGALAAAAKGGIGISITPTPYGSMLVAVATNSPAAAAGLKQGEVIEAVNGVDIKGMDPAKVADLIARAGATVSLSIVGVGTVSIRR